jgi:hypothetical protein
VRDGRFVSDERTDLPEGTEVELQVTKVADPWAGMDADERADLESSIEEGFNDLERGDHMEARAFMAQLRQESVRVHIVGRAQRSIERIDSRWRDEADHPQTLSPGAGRADRAPRDC